MVIFNSYVGSNLHILPMAPMDFPWKISSNLQVVKWSCGPMWRKCLWRVAAPVGSVWRVERSSRRQLWWVETLASDDFWRFCENLRKSKKDMETYSNHILIWLVVSNMAFICHNMWDNPSHWLIFLKPPTSNHMFNHSEFDVYLDLRQYGLASDQETHEERSRAGGVLWSMEGLSLAEILHPSAFGFPWRRPSEEPLRGLPGAVGGLQWLVRLGSSAQCRVGQLPFHVIQVALGRFRGWGNVNPGLKL